MLHRFVGRQIAPGAALSQLKEVPMQDINVALVGLGGFGIHYVNALLSAAEQHHVKFIAGIDPAPQGCAALAEIQRRGIPLYPSLEAFLSTPVRADLIALASPLQLHCQQVIQALEAGSHVICEKPLGASPDQARQMIQARDKAGKIVAIAYQWSFAPTTGRLKRDILAGRFGAPRRFATLTCWPRGDSYYARNNWAGKVRDDAGRLVLDSPANNACAHFLHYMFYLLGPTPQNSAQPASVSAELYRANAIQNYDTAAIRSTTASGVELLFLASHVTANNRNPVCRFEFENATILYGDQADDHLRVRFSTGQVEDYGVLPGGDNMDKLWSTVDAIRSSQSVLCGIEAAVAQTVCMYAAQQSVPEMCVFPPDTVRRENHEGSHRLIVAGLDALLERCYAEFKMPSEIGAPWARPGKTVQPERIASAITERASSCPIKDLS